MHFVYILRSTKALSRIYIGCTTNLERRFSEHNSKEGKGYTHKYRPWELLCYIAFKERVLAENFEYYLKRGSGFAFMKKRLIPKLKPSVDSMKDCRFYEALA